MKKIELLSPAGSFEALKAAVNYGADAVYLGGSSFSARAFAKNFDHEEMSEAVKYCHLRGVKVYVTLNTLLTEKELSNALEEARFYYSINVDALIIQDLGLYYLLKKEMPDFDLHASTQMHIHNISGVRNAIRLGYSKVVLARESDLQLIREACREDIEIECFVHGAICVSYSGQCLMSSLSKQRSANKGMCAQCCRLRYELIDTETKEKIRTDTEYLLSPKDMFLLNDIPDLIEAGVSSLKIEGRMKSPSYVGLVTSIYRRAIDAYYEGKRFELGGKEYRDLLTVFNRGFTNSYLHDSQDDIFGNIRPNHMGIKVGRVISCRGKKCLIKLSDELKQFDGIRIIDEKNDEGRILNTLTVNGKYVSSAHKDEIIELKVDAPVKEGSAVVKTLDHELEKTLENYPVRKRPISISLKLKCGLPVRAVCMLGDMRFEKEYGIIPEKAKTSPLTKKDLFDIFSKTNESPFELKDISCDMDDVFIVRSRLNEIRRDLYHSFEEHILASFKRQKRRIPELNEINISQDRNDIVESHIPLENSYGYRILERDPVINFKGIYRHPSVVSEFGGLFNAQDHKIAYYTLNICNSYACELLLRLDFDNIILSTELKDSQITDLIDAFRKRNGLIFRPHILSSGRRPVMYIRRDPFKKYSESGHDLLLKDGNNEYRIRYQPECTELVENRPFINTFNNRELTGRFIVIDEKEDLKWL